ncbi:MAG: gliding motility-associated C-terminal domain-containing protein [Phaeodactylibacter sp.]|nr:gliding motility-associated C-terminal domain-containing protein [Phaeodactylibacter sp.]
MPQRSIFVLLFVFLAFGLHGQDIFLSTLTGQLYSLNLDDCSYELVGAMPVSTTDISFHPNGKLYAISGAGRLYEINVASGGSSLIHTFEIPAGQLYTALTISADGTFYACGLDGELWSYSLATDTGQFLGNVGYGAEGDLAFFGGELYMAAVGDNIVRVDIGNPANSTVVINDNVPGRIFGIVSYAASCEEVQTFALTDNAANIYLIDFDNASLSLYCQIPLAVSGGASTFEFLGSNPVNILDVSANGFSCESSSGAISVQASGGIGALSYSIDGINFQASPVFNNLPAGDYNVYVQDEVGCLVDETVDVGLDGPMFTDLQITFASCGLDNGGVSFNIVGGAAPYQLSLNGGPFTSATQFGDLAPGSYTIEVFDDNGCSFLNIVNIGNISSPAFSGLEVTNTSCGEDNGGISFAVSGGKPPYVYRVNGMEVTSPLLEDVSAGTYALEVVDDSGCVLTETVAIAGSTGLSIEELLLENSSCGLANGRAEIITAGGAEPLEYNLSGLPPSATPVFMDVSAGNYTLTITDAAGCVATTEISLSGSEPPILTQDVVVAASCNEKNGQLQFTVTGGAGGGQLSLNGRALGLTNQLDELAAGDYLLIATDSLACADTLAFRIPSGLCPAYLPNAFSPNDDGVNDNFRPMAAGGLDAMIHRFIIFDRWGGMVHQVEGLPFSDPAVAWKGRKNDKPLPAGVYVYLLEMAYATGETVLLTGDVLLVR